VGREGLEPPQPKAADLQIDADRLEGFGAALERRPGRRTPAVHDAVVAGT
jgi:hypothetical protein